MKIFRKTPLRYLAPGLVLVLAACSSGEQEAEQPGVQVAEPAVAAADSPPAQAEPAPTEAPAMPEGLEISGRFADMFITEINNDFNPGLQVGEQFPAIRALYDGDEVMSIDRFVRDKGAIFIAARSVDW